VGGRNERQQQRGDEHSDYRNAHFCVISEGCR
jgi:hypothetical protein